MKRILCPIIGLLVFFLLTSCSNHQSGLYKLLIYYGIPVGVNQVWDIDKASEIFAGYDYIVFGEGLEEPTDEHHDSTKRIISKIHQIHSQAQIFGYVDLGQTTNHFPYMELVDRFQKWKKLGIDGIFLDNAGYDYEVSRMRLNSALKAIHVMGMQAFVNAWNPEDIMGDMPDEFYNPDGTETELSDQDYYLLEEFLEPYDVTIPNSKKLYFEDFKWKMDKALEYRTKLGIKLLSISRIDYSTLTEDAIKEYFHMNEAAAGVFSLDGYGIAPIEYSSSDIDQDIVLEQPYMQNYYEFYTTDVKYKTDEENQEYRRGPFLIHSSPGKHFYRLPR